MRVDATEFMREIRKFGEQGLQRTRANLEVSGFAMQSDAKNRAPVKFGELRNSIVTEKPHEFAVSIVATAKHAPFMEFGTGGLVDIPEEMTELAAEYKGKGIRNVNIRPRPFLWPSLLEEVPKFKERMRKELDRLAKNT